jgi:hypothetical protein
MASTVLVRDVFWRVSVILQDTTPQFQRWPERELVHWLNDAQVAITKFLPMACSRVDAIKLAAGTRQSIETIAAADCKPGDGSVPGVAINGTQLLDVVRNMGSNGTTPGKAIRIVEREVLDSQSPTWHTLTGAAVSSFVYDPRTPRYFYVFPGVTGTVWAEIAYTAQPIAIPAGGAPGAELYGVDGGSAQKISIADEFTDDLVNYVVARAHMKDTKYGDPSKAVAHSNLFTGSLNAKVTAVKGENPNLQRLPGVTEVGR